ncbi:MAG: hypothetical protein GY913_00030, partial [Proteobacteria bacterium]|nr:hypothetical protein [Pseudomonadota bacterium]
TEIIADGVDDDCDNSDLCYVDDDGDGWGDDDGSTVVGDGDLNCNEPSAGEANDMQDCLDSNGDAYPGAAENESGTDCMEDADGDGWGDDTPPGGVTAGLDCDDGESTSYPGATEITADEIDSDCDGGEICYEDSDYDGYGSTSTTSSTTDADCQDTGESLVDTDCLDTNADAFPGSAENESSTICMEDADGDGYGDDAAPGGVTDGNDCDDGDSAVNPAASEITADGIDNDCDSSYNCYRDLDLDGYGTTTTRASTDSDCTDSYESNVSTDCYDNSSLGSETYPGAAPNDSGTSCMRDDDEDDYGDTTAPGTAVAGTDCDDDDADINAGESETTADGVDQDCDGYETCYDDADEDGYRTTTTTSTTDTDCSDADHALSSDDDGDCDDADEFTHPGAAENESSTACRTDADEDGYGSDSAPSGGTAGSDCDDGDDGINVAADETVADGTDQDCDGYDDCYEDLDQDGYGSTTEITGTDLTCANTGESDDDDDCDDSDEFTYPGAAESESASECQTDADEDGYGSTTAPSGGDAGTDCDDGDDAINPGETEADDDVDQDCDDIVDEGFYSAGDLIFSELMANPYADEPDGEWFEVYNASGADIYLDGWYFKLGSNTQAFYVGPGDAFIADGDYLVFCSDDTQTLNHADTVAGGCDYVYGSDVNSASEQGDTYDTNAGLANVGEQLDIMIGGTTIDTVDTSDASFTAPSEGSSIALDIDWLTDTDNDDGANWCESTELFFDTTPGASADEYGTPQTGAVCDVDPA